MIISCPFCGPRPLREFAYRGDADNAADRPEPGKADQAAWAAYVYDRANPAGEHAEVWHHVGGCRRHLRVERNTVSNRIEAVYLIGPGADQ